MFLFDSTLNLVYLATRWTRTKIFSAYQNIAPGGPFLDTPPYRSAGWGYWLRGRSFHTSRSGNPGRPEAGCTSDTHTSSARYSRLSQHCYCQFPGQRWYSGGKCPYTGWSPEPRRSWREGRESCPRYRPYKRAYVVGPAITENRISQAESGYSRGDGWWHSFWCYWLLDHCKHINHGYMYIFFGNSNHAYLWVSNMNRVLLSIILLHGILNLNA